MLAAAVAIDACVRILVGRCFATGERSIPAFYIIIHENVPKTKSQKGVWCNEQRYVMSELAPNSNYLLQKWYDLDWSKPIIDVMRPSTIPRGAELRMVLLIYFDK